MVEQETSRQKPHPFLHCLNRGRASRREQKSGGRPLKKKKERKKEHGAPSRRQRRIIWALTESAAAFAPTALYLVASVLLYFLSLSPSVGEAFAPLLRLRR